MTLIPDAAGREYDVRHWRLGSVPWQAIQPAPGPRARVIVDNDFAGDPDDLYHLVHQILSPNTEIRAVVGSRLRDGDVFDTSGRTAANAVLVARDVFARMGLDSTEVIHQGSNEALADRATPRPSAAVDAIVAEAMREDTDTPLFYLAGGGLTDLASAYLTEPRIAERLTVVWIGGLEHEGLADPPPNAMPIEYNLLIDVTAGQVVFNDSDLDVWQVPRDVYRQCLVSDAELRLRVAAAGPLGRYLYDELATVVRGVTEHRGTAPGESYALGDSPLVLLTALRSLFEAAPSSSRHTTIPTPSLQDDGTYLAVPGARPLRVYTWVDTRLMFEDFHLKLREFSRWSGASD
ncbi:nucleoside hydrolase [Glycomyces sp. NPDC047010]|uniref:nucleoside hydrolase n=1 Tax=Glycomyces sp. NPDC047010 TaxID=3155023 RepID=UPI0033FFFD15